MIPLLIPLLIPLALAGGRPVVLHANRDRVASSLGIELRPGIDRVLVATTTDQATQVSVDEWNRILGGRFR